MSRFTLFASPPRFPCLPVAVSALLGGLLLAELGRTQDPFATDPFSDPDAANLAVDPFDSGESDRLFGRSDVPRLESEIRGPAPDPSVRQLVERARSEPRFLGDSIASLARMGAWLDLEQLLSSVSADALEPSLTAGIADTVGPALMLRIMSREEIGESSRQLLEACQVASSERRLDQQRLRDAVGELGSSSIDDRLAATRSLLVGGEASIQALVESIVSDPETHSRDDQLRLLSQFGPGGLESLGQLALYGELPQRAAAVSAIARLDPRGSVDDLVTALHAADSSADERQVAAAALRRVLGGVPGRSASLELLANRLRTVISEAARIDNDGQTRTIWSVDESRASVIPIQSYEIVAAYRRGYDAVARLHRVGDLPPEVAADALIADLSYRVLVDPEWGTESARQTISPVHAVDAIGLSYALERAVDAGNWPAAVGLLRLIDDSLSPQERNQLLRGGGGDPTPLVRAASASEPQVRYEAVSAIMRIAGDETYPGISSVRRTLAEMRSLGQRPIVVLVETRMEVSQRLERLLDQLGYQVQLVGSVRSLESVLQDGGDLRFIIAKTDLADTTPIEMLDRVRRTSIGRNIPIVFFGEPHGFFRELPTGLGEGRWDAPTLLINEPLTTAGLRPLLDLVELRRRLPPLTGVDRRLYREHAVASF